jgi:hypothetical protein
MPLLRNPRESLMKLATLTALATAMLLAVSAQAQTGSSSNSMSNGSMSSMSSDSSMTCQAMMDKANGMSQPTDANKKAMAMKQMDMAKAAMAKGNEASCKSHMKMAMHNMM